MGYAGMFIMPLLTLVFGIVGVVKDRSVAMSIVGLNLSLAVFVIMLINYFMRFMVYNPYYYY